MSSSERDRRTTGRILVVDDELALREMATQHLRSVGHDVDEVSSYEQASSRVHARPYDVVLTDLVLDGPETGIHLLEEIRKDGIACEVIIMTGKGGVKQAVEATRLGAYDFITKPLTLTRLEIEVAKAIEKRRLEQDLLRLSSSAREGFGGLSGSSPAMQSVFQVLERAAQSDSTVLILGESGTGKEIAARAIHAASSRQQGPFVAVHCGALPPALLESELFGHKKGAFTGAESDRAGLIAGADHGTLFLDEIGTAPPALQIKLLRVLQDRRVRPVGGLKDTQVDIRVIAATNVDLDAELEARRFRQDLYYRLATIVVQLPPLRSRREDIPLLVGALMEKLETKTGRRARLSPRALERL
ncbi:MAG: sigma-54-dependent Fis family transcriptional regulator, partial [Acidobacteriota bacterium]